MSTIINGTSSAITFPDSTVQNSAGLTAGGTIASGTITALTATTGTVTTLTAPTSTITTLNAPSGVLATQNGMNGIASAWVYFDSGGAIAGTAFNVSSVTRNSTGVYTVNFTTAMSSANYAVIACAGNSNNSNAMVNASANATGSCQVTCQVGTSAGYQDSSMFVVVHSR